MDKPIRIFVNQFSSFLNYFFPSHKSSQSFFKTYPSHNLGMFRNVIAPLPQKCVSDQKEESHFCHNTSPQTKQLFHHSLLKQNIKYQQTKTT